MTLIKNSAYNAFMISVHIFVGYLAAVFLNDRIETDVRNHYGPGEDDGTDTILNNVGHSNNIYISILFYYIGIYYNNTLNKCNGYMLC
jgi:hypothetical protein